MKIYEKDYYYHFTDAQSALSILIDGVIKPYKMKNKSELFDTKHDGEIRLKDHDFILLKRYFKL